MSSSDERTNQIEADPPVAASGQALHDRSALALIAVERTRMPMVVTDPRRPDNPIVMANKAFLDLTGYAPEEVVGRNCRFLQGPGTSARVVADLAAAIAEPREMTVQIQNYRKDGSAFWNELHISPVYDDAGALAYFFASQLDRTVYRKLVDLEAVEHRLLMEVDHRALNVLAIVQGIVRLSRADDPQAYAAAVQARVQVLATAHNLLSETRWASVPMDRLARRYVEPFGIPDSALGGPPVAVRPDAVQPLAMVLHELGANAIAHGALAAPGGGVEVSWDIDAEQSLELLWVETGGTRPPTTRRRGFGLTMISAIVDRQLKGRAEFDWAPQGLAVRIIVPGVSSRAPTRAPR